MPPVPSSPPRDGGARARLDPTASPEVSSEYPYEPSTSVPFGVAFALSRRRAFLAGCGAGASGAFVLAGAVALVIWLSGPRSESRVTAAPPVQVASTTELAPARLAAASRSVGGARAAADVARRVRRAPAVVAAPRLVEEVPASRPIPVVREASARGGEDEGSDSPTSVTGSEPKPLAEAEEVDAAVGSEDGPSAADEAPAPADESSEEPNRVALVPAVAPDQAPGSERASEAPADEGPGQ
jgi:hypothetical protein